MNGWDAIGGEAPAVIDIRGRAVQPGDRVRLHPRSNRDPFDRALDGRMATVETLELDLEGVPHLVVSVDEDPAREFRDRRLPAHRFFFGVDEVEPIDAPAQRGTRVLVAGIGNVFLGDDGFGVEVVRRLADRAPREDVDVVEFGIRGMDLAYALERYDAAILVDASARGDVPGTVIALDVDAITDAPSIETHGMDPVKVLALARALGPVPARVLAVLCEPATLGNGDDISVGLSAPVAAALAPAMELIDTLLSEMRTEVVP